MPEVQSETRSNRLAWELFNSTLRAQVAEDMRSPDGTWARLNRHGQAHISTSEPFRTLHRTARQRYHAFRDVIKKENPDMIGVAASLVNLSDLCITAEYQGKKVVTINHSNGLREQLNPLEANARLIGYEAAALEMFNLPPFMLSVFTDNALNIYEYLHNKNPEFTSQLMRKIINTYPDNPLSKRLLTPHQSTKKDPIEHQFASKASTYYAQLKAHYVRLPPKANLKKYGREIELLLANTALRPKEPINFANPEGMTPHSREDTYAYLTALDLLTKQAK